MQVALGLLEERRTPRPRYLHPGLEAVLAYDEAASSAYDRPPNPDVGTAAQRAQARAKVSACPCPLRVMRRRWSFGLSGCDSPA